MIKLLVNKFGRKNKEFRWIAVSKKNHFPCLKTLKSEFT